jgi:hypothetical protein
MIEKLAQNTVTIVRGYIDNIFQSLDVRLKAVEAIEPIPGPQGKRGEKGESIQGEKGADGINGKDGIDGKDGKDGLPGKDGIDGIPGRDGRDAKDGKDGMPGRDGSDGKNGKDGVNGLHGKDGLGFDDLSVDYDGNRTFTLKFARGEQVKEFAFDLPIVLDKGVYREENVYVKGDGVTSGGSYWIAQREKNITKPGLPDSGWRLAVKKGRDGRDNQNG